MEFKAWMEQEEYPQGVGGILKYAGKRAWNQAKNQPSFITQAANGWANGTMDVLRQRLGNDAGAGDGRMYSDPRDIDKEQEDQLDPRNYEEITIEVPHSGNIQTMMQAAWPLFLQKVKAYKPNMEQSLIDAANRGCTPEQFIKKNSGKINSGKQSFIFLLPLSPNFIQC